MNTESVVAVFYDNDKAYDMMWTVFIIKVGKIKVSQGNCTHGERSFSTEDRRKEISAK